MLTWGQTGTGDGQFNSPSGICADGNGKVYVADMENNRIQVFSSTGSFLFSFGSQGSGYSQFGRPTGVVVDESGDIFVVEQDNARVQKFNSAGVYLTMWGSQGSGVGQFNMPLGIACDQNGNVYVADSSNDRIQKFSSDGTFITSWGAYGFGNGQFSLPCGLAVDKDNRIFVVDQFNSRIQEFDTNGNFLLSWGNFGSGDGQFNVPQGIAVDKSGSIYVADTYNYRVQKFVQSSATVPTATGSTPSSTNGVTQGSALPDFGFLTTPILIAVITLFSVLGFVWWVKSGKDIIAGVLGPGWQFYLYPTNQEPPGTIIRINKSKTKFTVTQLDVKPRSSVEVPGKQERENKTTFGVLLRFNRQNDISSIGRGMKVQHLSFEMENAKGEEVNDEDIDPLVRKWIKKIQMRNPECEYRPDSRYFIIRKTLSTRKITYILTKEQSNFLRQKTKLGEGILETGTNVSSTATEHHELPQEFPEEMRIMFMAEEIELKEVNGKIETKHLHRPIKKPAKYKEEKR